jgi:hypothetical protein
MLHATGFGVALVVVSDPAEAKGDSMSEKGSAGQARDRVSTSARALMLVGSAGHIAYGVGALLAPERMVSAQYAPDTHGLADPRLLLRAFGGHLLITGCLALAATRSRRQTRSAAVLCLLINTFDVTSAVLEWRARNKRDQTVTGGIALSGSGIITFAAALRALSR